MNLKYKIYFNHKTDISTITECLDYSVFLTHINKVWYAVFRSMQAAAFSHRTSEHNVKKRNRKQNSFCDLSRLRTICEKSVRCKKLAGKNSTNKILWKLTTHISLFDYFLIQLNFIPYRTRKSLCLVHNYRFYREMVRDVKHKKFVSWSSINNTK